MGVNETDEVKQALLDIKLCTEFCGIEQEKETVLQVNSDTQLSFKRGKGG